MLNKFLHYNRHCPQCGEPLHLYMQWFDSILFKAQEYKQDNYQFTPMIVPSAQKELKESFMILTDHGDSIETEFDSPGLANEAKRRQIYFFYVCNPAGIKEKSGGDHEIHLYKACYYRSTLLLEFKKDEKEDVWNLQFTDHQPGVVNKDESFAFSSVINDLTKIYMMTLDYEANHTVLYHYGVTEAQKAEKDFKPNVFEKTIPLLNPRPKFGKEDKWKLIERFDNWILMS